MEIQDVYQKAIRYAAEKHAVLQQTLPDSIIPYAVHLSNVAMEIHDVLEDTAVTAKELETDFGIEVTTGVLALTKDKSLSHQQQMIDSLQRLPSFLICPSLNEKMVLLVA